MKTINFKLKREPCVPIPYFRDARKAKEYISSLGGRFYRFSINGCATTTDLKKYLLEKYGLNESAIIDSFNFMAETAIPELETNLKELWGLVEKLNDTIATTFVGYAFTQKELDLKTKLFVAGVINMKECLQTSLESIMEDCNDEVYWDI